MDMDGLIAKEPLAILDRRMNKCRGRLCIEILIQWSNCFLEDATWRIFMIFRHSILPSIFEDNNCFEREAFLLGLVGRIEEIVVGYYYYSYLFLYFNCVIGQLHCCADSTYHTFNTWLWNGKCSYVITKKNLLLFSLILSSLSHTQFLSSFLEILEYWLTSIQSLALLHIIHFEWYQIYVFLTIYIYFLWSLLLINISNSVFLYLGLKKIPKNQILQNWAKTSKICAKLEKSGSRIESWKNLKEIWWKVSILEILGWIWKKEQEGD